MPRKLYKGLIPFTLDGDLLEFTYEYPGTEITLEDVGERWVPEYRIKKTLTWKDNYTFRARLRVADMERGRSAARFILEGEEGQRYPMFMSDMLVLTDRGIEPGGYSEGEWAFAKRGKNYGITPIV